jgi:cytochrome d ubiquinol oxidase subunit II
VPQLEQRLRRASLVNLVCALPFLLFILGSLLVMPGYSVDGSGVVSLVPGKYLANLLAMPLTLGLLVAGLVLVIWGVVSTAFLGGGRGIWFGGLGTVLVGLAVFAIAGYNDTPFYPSKADLQSSLSIHNASSSHYTLTAMTYVALVIPLVLGYIVYVWKLMNERKIGPDDLEDSKAY